MRFLAVSVAIVLPAVLGARACLRRSNMIALAVEWTHASHKTVMTCCGVVPYDARMRSAMLPSSLLGSWIFVSGIWDVPDGALNVYGQLRHPFGAGACAIAAGCVLYGLISLGTGARLLRLWRNKRLSNTDEDLFFKRWAFREFSGLLLAYFVTHVPAMVLTLKHISAGFSAAPVLYIMAWVMGPFYVLLPTIFAAMAAFNLHRRVLQQHGSAEPDGIRGEAIKALDGRWRVDGRDARGVQVTETIRIRCRAVLTESGRTYTVVDGEQDDAGDAEPFQLMHGQLIEDEGEFRVQFEQCYSTKHLDVETGGSAQSMRDGSDDSTTLWSATLTTGHASDSRPRMNGWWSGQFKQSDFSNRFHATKLASSQAGAANDQSFAKNDSAETDTTVRLSEGEYAQALASQLSEMQKCEPHTAAVLPLISQFRQGCWWAMPVQMAEQVAIASILFGSGHHARQVVCVSVLVAALVLACFNRPYVSLVANCTSIAGRLSNLAFILLGALLDHGVIVENVGYYLFWSNTALTCLMFFASLGPMRLVSSCRKRCQQLRRNTAETKLVFAEELELAMNDQALLEWWSSRSSSEGEPLARFHQPITSCCPQPTSDLGLHNLEMLDLRELGVLPSHTKRSLAVLLAQARCPHLLVLKAHLVDAQPSTTLDVTTEGRQALLQNQQLGPEDMLIVAGWLRARVPATKLTKLDLSHNFAFGKETAQLAKDGDTVPGVVHAVDSEQLGWTHLAAALQGSCVSSLTLRGTGMGAGGQRTLGTALLDGLRMLERLDLAENPLRVHRSDSTLQAFSGLCHSLVGSAVRELSVARCGLDAAALDFLAHVSVDADGAVSTQAPRWSLANSPVRSLRSLDLSGNQITDSQPFVPSALEGYEQPPGELSARPVAVLLDTDVSGLESLCAAASKAQQLTRLDLGGCCLGAKALKVLRTKLDWPNALRTLCLSDNPGLVGRQDPHGQVLKPDAHAAGWAGFCEVLGKSQIAELQLRRVGMGPKGLETLALLLPQPPFNAALTSLDISENFLFGSKPLHDQVPDGPRKQLPDQEQGGWRRLCAALPETCVGELVVQEIGLGRQGADILAATMAAAAANAEQPGGKPLRLRNVDLRRNEALSVGYLAQFEDPEKNLLVRH